jgi:hypothetical protein
MAVEAVVPSVPRNGSYLPVAGLTNIDEGAGGDVRVELEECSTCHGAVSGSALPDHEAWHAAQGGAEPKMAR